MRVYVYWNLHKDCYSIVAREGVNKGRVIALSPNVTLADVTFSVQAAGRLKSITRKRTQHAGMTGTLISLERADTGTMRQITYNPHKHESFVYRDTLARLDCSARVICLTANGAADCYAD